MRIGPVSFCVSVRSACQTSQTLDTTSWVSASVQVTCQRPTIGSSALAVLAAVIIIVVRMITPESPFIVWLPSQFVTILHHQEGTNSPGGRLNTPKGTHRHFHTPLAHYCLLRIRSRGPFIR